MIDFGTDAGLAKAGPELFRCETRDDKHAIGEYAVTGTSRRSRPPAVPPKPSSGGTA